MMQPNENFTIDCSSPDVAVLTGVLRLSSPAAYEEWLAPLREALTSAEATYTIDISKVQFLNSSGITGLSRLVLLARTLGKPLVFIGSTKTAWHGKTLRLIARLYTGLEVRLQ